MDDIEIMIIERACLRLVTEYCHLVDHGDAARIAELFTDDGVFVGAEGRAALRDFFRARQDNAARMSRHVCDNTLIDVVDGPVLAGEYRDVFVRTPVGWRFVRRDLVIDFKQVGIAL